MKKFWGTGVALVTPFNKDFSVDYNALKKIVNYVLENGVNYLVALGTTSEAPTLNDDEKEKVVKTIIEAAAGRCPIVLGMGGNNTQVLVEQIKNQNFEQIDAILSVTPYYNKPQQNGLIAHFRAVADASPVPVILYNVPGRTGVNLSAQSCLKLAEHPNIIAVKEASGNLQQCMEILRDKPENFDVISGDDALTLPFMALGAKGVISVAANLYPNRYSTMVSSQLNNEYDKALKLHYKMLEMNNLIFIDGSPSCVKELLYHIGLCRELVRLPLVSVSNNARQLLLDEWNTNFSRK
ncbi:MAG: 4-hydroxy-tetrahydrodipicolinate synthase [Lentimicrobiaceae bacterium]|jgi:4-hydroxy-tetrahydrodipicolinate synthase|nr:4-hydroxy-tetrahydrodipicolinate synthase [Lentimicrobiaceae bacterium]